MSSRSLLLNTKIWKEGVYFKYIQYRIIPTNFIISNLVIVLILIKLLPSIESKCINSEGNVMRDTPLRIPQ